MRGLQMCAAPPRSLIKAYGHAQDPASARRCWAEMLARGIRPTAITTGCMVGAVSYTHLTLPTIPLV